MATSTQDIQAASPGRGRSSKLVLLGLAVIAVGAFFVWSYTCPCTRVPGGYLFGNVVEEPVKDWSFANEAAVCQIQVSGMIPHSINLNCMATPEGKLYLSCSNCAPKYWSRHVVSDPVSRLRVKGNVYPVTLTRVTDTAEMDLAWETRVKKLQVVASKENPAVPIGTPRPATWWTFRVESR